MGSEGDTGGTSSLPAANGLVQSGSGGSSTSNNPGRNAPATAVEFGPKVWRPPLVKVGSLVQASTNCPDWGQPEELPDDELVWPVRPDQRPEVVRTVEEFLETLYFEPHMDRVVVLPDGLRLLGQSHGCPEVLRKAVSKSRNMRGFLNVLGDDAKAGMKGRLWHYGKRNTEKEIRKNNKKKTFADVEGVFKEQEANGLVPPDAALYLSEMRWLNKVPHPACKEELVKTATNVDIYDIDPISRRMPLWERSEGGIFVGERGAGSGLHVDQCLWSNVGRNWCGHKLFAIWPWEERHKILDEAGKGAIVGLPLTDEHVDFLSRAKCIAHVRPGDVWVFSGGQPHTAMCVGDGLNVTAYESIVPAHPEALGLLVRSNTKECHWRNCWMDDVDLDELYEDVIDRVQEARRELASISSSPPTDNGVALASAADLVTKLRNRLEDCAEAMRNRGDAYCKELWTQEDSGERRRRREDGSDDYYSADEAEEKQGTADEAKDKQGTDSKPVAAPKTKATTAADREEDYSYSRSPTPDGEASRRTQHETRRALQQDIESCVKSMEEPAALDCGKRSPDADGNGHADRGNDLATKRQKFENDPAPGEPLWQ